MLLHKGLTHIHSQKKPGLHFGQRRSVSFPLQLHDFLQAVMNCCDVFSQEHIRTPLTMSGSSKVLTKDDWRLQLLFEGVIYQKPERAVNHLETDCMKVQFILTLTDLRWGCFSWWKPDNWLFGGEMSWNISSRVKKPSINPRFLQSL